MFLFRCYLCLLRAKWHKSKRHISKLNSPSGNSLVELIIFTASLLVLISRAQNSTNQRETLKIESAADHSLAVKMSGAYPPVRGWRSTCRG